MAGNFCDWCGGRFKRRSNKKFCSVSCRIRSSRSHMDQGRRDRTNEAKRSWNRLNKDKRDAYRYRKSDYYNSLSRLYQASKVSATPPWLTDEHKKQILEFYALSKDCSVVTGEAYHVDHIVPLRGRNICGLHVPWNLQVLPSDINISKGNRHE
jgi:hypothetical protein